MIYLKLEWPKITHVKKGRNNMKTKTTIAFSCPEKTAILIDEFAARHGISRSACITMMCNAFLVADSKTFPAFTISDLREEAFDHERRCE